MKRRAQDRAVEDAVVMIEGALLGTDRLRAIWDDADYLCAVFAILTGDGIRARDALLNGQEARREAAEKRGT